MLNVMFVLYLALWMWLHTANGAPIASATHMPSEVPSHWTGRHIDCPAAVDHWATDETVHVFNEAKPTVIITIFLLMNLGVYYAWRTNSLHRDSSLLLYAIAVVAVISASAVYQKCTANADMVDELDVNAAAAMAPRTSRTNEPALYGAAPIQYDMYAAPPALYVKADKPGTYVYATPPIPLDRYADHPVLYVSPAFEPY